MAAEHFDTSTILIDHEKRISTMEGTLAQMNRRLARLEVEVGLVLATIIGGVIAVLIQG